MPRRVRLSAQEAIKVSAIIDDLVEALREEETLTTKDDAIVLLTRYRVRLLEVFTR